YVHSRLQPPGAIRTQPWHQQFLLAQQLERLQQVQGLSARLREQEAAQRGEPRLRLRRRRCTRRGRQHCGVLTSLPSTARAPRSLPSDGLHKLECLCLAQRLQQHLADRRVLPQVGQLDGKLRVELQLIAAYRA